MVLRRVSGNVVYAYIDDGDVSRVCVLEQERFPCRHDVTVSPDNSQSILPYLLCWENGLGTVDNSGQHPTIRLEHGRLTLQESEWVHFSELLGKAKIGAER